MSHEAMKKSFKQIPTMKSKLLSHDKKDKLLLKDIGCACYLTHFAAWYNYFVNQKTQIFFLPVRFNLIFVCNLTDLRYSVSFNGVKWVVVDVDWTLYFFCGVTHECISSVFEVLFLFWFLVMYSLSSWDEMDVHVELLADDVWSAEDDNTGFLSVEVDIFDQLF